jgi:hypothetical protein
MPAVATAALQPCRAGRQVQLVVHDQHLFRIDTVVVGHGPHRLTAAIHVGGRFQQAHAAAGDAGLAQLAVELRFIRKAGPMGGGQRVDEPEAGVVPVLLVLRPGVAEACDQLDGAHDSHMKTPDARDRASGDFVAR